MAPTATTPMAVTLLATALIMAMSATTALAAATPNCDSAASALLPCYSYVTGTAGDAKPPAECCGGLSSLNTNSPACLCQLITQLNGTAASQPSVNVTRAFDLPRDCTIILKTSDCPFLANLPTASPASPTTASPGPTAAAGPEAAALVPANDVPRLSPTSWTVVVGAAGVGALVQALW